MIHESPVCWSNHRRVFAGGAQSFGQMPFIDAALANALCT